MDILIIGTEKREILKEDTGMGGNEGPWGYWTGEGKEGNWGTGGGGSKKRLLSPKADFERGRAPPGACVLGRGGGWEYLCGNCWLTTLG
jgi:hypothetical protein